ncbi:MAG: ThuA domain-containing protein [Pirellulales bacterium]
MRHLLRLSFVVAFLLSCVQLPAAEDRGIFDYKAQKAADKKVKKIVFIGDSGTHGPLGNHEFVAGFMLLSRQLHAAYPNVHCVVHTSKKWPGDLSHADAVIVGLNHGGRAASDADIFSAVRRGAGFMAVHYGVEVKKGEQGKNFTQWMGGYYETSWSVNPWWTPKFESFPDHPVARGVKPFSVRDEWYYHMRFVGDMKGVTPILTDVPPLNSAGGNSDARKAVSQKQPQHMAWAYNRPDGGRGFGFTGLHAHANLADDGFRTVLLNASAWVAGLKIPKDGVPSKAPSLDELKKLAVKAKAVREGK